MACFLPARPGVQLTWMDAKVGDWVVTPRIGKPVEVQALWLNALRCAAKWNPETGLHLAVTAEASLSASVFGMEPPAASTTWSM